MKSKIKNIGLAGGGIYGIAHVAVLNEIERNCQYFDITSVSGSSVGSIVAALYAVGYTASELRNIILDMNFYSLICDSYVPYVMLYENFGMYKGTKLENEIESLIRTKTNVKLCTFCQININLNIVATNLNMQCARVFNKKNSPDVPISKAIRMSVGYPIIMTPVLFEKDYYGDGGEFMNYPITLFDNIKETLGVTFSSFNENSDGTLINRVAINDVYDYIKSIASTLSRATYISQFTKEYIDRSIIVKIDQNISSINFNLTLDEKNAIYDCGTKSFVSQFPKIIESLT